MQTLLRHSNRIDVVEAVRLYDRYRNWRKVARRMIRFNGMPFTADAVWFAVRQRDLGLREEPMTAPKIPHPPLEPFTLEEWDDLIGRHLHAIEAGADMIKSHIIQLMGVPEWETRAETKLNNAVRMLSNALLHIEKARQDLGAKPHVR